jgi:hypothetical protein
MSNEQITRDLVRKVGDDIGAVLRRTISIAPQPHMPIAVSAGASVVGLLAAMLDTDKKPDPDPDCVLLAGLLIARCGIGGSDPIGAAYSDFDALKKAGRTVALPSKERDHG